MRYLLLWGEHPKWVDRNPSLMGLDFRPDNGSNNNGLLYAEHTNGATFDGGRYSEDLSWNIHKSCYSDLSRFAL